ncbi:MAG: RsmE family RNA methyltransferase [Planctomycetota bacterium]
MVDRFFLAPGAVVQSGVVHLDAHESEHAVRSRRLREGDIIELLDGEGLLASGRIRSARKQECVVEIDTYKICERVLPEVYLALSVPRGPRMDDLVDAINQLGIVSISPVVFERSVSAREDASPARVERWRRIAREAAKQSGEPFVTKILAPVRLDAFLATAFVGSRFLLHPEAGAPQLAAALAGAETTIPTRTLVGPEGGLTVEEVERAKQSGERVVRLGRSLLRIETAALAACAMARLRQL